MGVCTGKCKEIALLKLGFGGTICVLKVQAYYLKNGEPNRKGHEHLAVQGIAQLPSPNNKSPLPPRNMHLNRIPTYSGVAFIFLGVGLMENSWPESAESPKPQVLENQLQARPLNYRLH